MSEATDMATALAARQLTPFEGRDVVGARVEIPGAAGGLREAMKVQPVEFRQGRKVYVLIECTVGPVKFDPVMVKGEDMGQDLRVHVLRAGTAAFVDEDFAREHIDGMNEKIRLANEEAAGILRIPGTEPTLTVLREALHDEDYPPDPGDPEPEEGYTGPVADTDPDDDEWGDEG